MNRPMSSERALVESGALQTTCDAVVFIEHGRSCRSQADGVAQPGAIIPPVLALPPATSRQSSAVGCGDARRSTPRGVRHTRCCIRRGWALIDFTQGSDDEKNLDAPGPVPDMR